MRKKCKTHQSAKIDKFGRCLDCRTIEAKIYYQANREDILARGKAWRLANKERISKTGAKAHLKNRYGLTSEDRQFLHDQQEGQCAICKANTLLVVDHSHTTGKVRGLLCRGCNHGLGNFKDDIATLLKAISYLEKN